MKVVLHRTQLVCSLVLILNISTVRIVSFVVHNQDVINEIKTIRTSFEWILHHLVNS